MKAEMTINIEMVESVPETMMIDSFLVKFIFLIIRRLATKCKRNLFQGTICI